MKPTVEDRRNPSVPDDYIRIARWRAGVGLTLVVVGMVGVYWTADPKLSLFRQVGSQISFALLLAGVVDVLVFAIFDALKARMTRPLRELEAKAQRVTEKMDELVKSSGKTVQSLTDKTDRLIQEGKLDGIQERLAMIEAYLSNHADDHDTH
jgi:hypothetical protein